VYVRYSAAIHTLPGNHRSICSNARVEAGGAPRASDPGDYSAPSLFKALETQLNLKLVKAKDVPVTMLVVDHAEQTPSEN
jgi:uncharacterized protein (TIGR03435 family)